MTARELYNSALIEINKLEAPSLLLEDYNYLINKAVQQYTNKVYNRYEINQQATDDMRILKSTAVLDIVPQEDGLVSPNETAEYYCELPENYLHILNCVVGFDKTKNAYRGSYLGDKLPLWMGKRKAEKAEKIPCPDRDGGKIVYPARKLTADAYPSLIVNAYLKPDVTRPYYFITNVIGEDILSNADELGELLGDTPTEGSGIKMQIRCGSTKKYTPVKAYIDYVRTPAKIVLTEEDLDLVDGQDRSQVIEFPDYVCYEIINEFSKLLLENASDPRLQTNLGINQTIAVPGAKS